MELLFQPHDIDDLSDTATITLLLIGQPDDDNDDGDQTVEISLSSDACQESFQIVNRNTAWVNINGISPSLLLSGANLSTDVLTITGRFFDEVTGVEVAGIAIDMDQITITSANFTLDTPEWLMDIQVAPALKSYSYL